MQAREGVTLTPAVTTVLFTCQRSVTATGSLEPQVKPKVHIMAGHILQTRRLETKAE